MLLSELKAYLKEGKQLSFQLPNGMFIPPHFHITEVGQLIHNFIDCGGQVRAEKKVNLQLWYDVDTDHRLSTEKLLAIIELSEEKLNLEDAKIEVEYQGNTVEKYNLSATDFGLQLEVTKTDCLAKDKCGIPEPKQKKALASLTEQSCCNPSSGCC